MTENESSSECQRYATRLASRIESLTEPYRGNAITWLENYAAQPIDDLDHDLAAFLARIQPEMRKETATNLEAVLDDALRHFGA